VLDRARQSVVGRALEQIGLTLVFSWPATVVAAAVVYGLASLVGRVLDAGSVYAHIGRPPNVSGWPAWALFLFGLGLLAAATTILRSWIVGSSKSLIRRFIGGPVLISLAGVGCAELLVTGYRLSAGSSGPAAAITKQTDVPSASSSAAAASSAPAVAPSTNTTSAAVENARRFPKTRAR